MPYPIFTPIAKSIYKNIINSDLLSTSNYNKTTAASNHNCWIRVTSAVGDGLIMASNPSIYSLEDTITLLDPNTSFTTPGYYGNMVKAGAIGINWKGAGVWPDGLDELDAKLVPVPLITAFNVKEGKDQISRQGTLTLKCFTLSQMEKVQEYLMGPGNTVFIEFGYSLPDGLQGLIDLTDTSKIVPNVTAFALDEANIQLKRLNCSGAYDCYFGYIVGGNVTSEDNSFNITINLRGVPGLPTYLQNQKTILKFIEDKTTKKRTVIDVPSAELYYTTDYTEYNASTDNNGTIAGIRRYKYLFNELPPVRQTPEVKDICDYAKAPITNLHGHWDFVNFDYVINKAIENSLGSKWNDFLESINLNYNFLLRNEWTVGDANIDKHNLISKNRYVRFEVAMEILNANNSAMGYKVGDTPVSVKINPKAKIGAFPGIFSTKPSKLLIPGKIPDFYKYYMNTSQVNINTIVDESGWIDNTISGLPSPAPEEYQRISFVQDKDLVPAQMGTGQKDANGKEITIDTIDHYEKAGYWGRLENLYVNFDMLCSMIRNSTNKSIRDVVISLLNEMSSAVNSFWNFNLRERYNKDLKQVELTIYDENWSGVNKHYPEVFYHMGEKSVFLEANLEIDIPSEMANQIVMNRNSLLVNSDSPVLPKINSSVFSSKPDAFLSGVMLSYKKAINENGKPSKNEPETYESLNNQWGALISQLQQGPAFGEGYVYYWNPSGKKIPVALGNINQYVEAESMEDGSKLRMQNIYPIEAFDNEDFINNAASKGVDVSNVPKEGKEFAEELGRVKKALKEKWKAKKTTAQTTLNNNLKKVDIVPNPALFGTEQILNPNENLKPGKSNFNNFNQNYKIYCCMEEQVFDAIKNNQFGKYYSTSQPLPIKYTFKILGRSGIRRGDVFNIVGIPAIYKDNGFFQVIEIEHTLEGSSWFTNITGQYRQSAEIIKK